MKKIYHIICAIILSIISVSTLNAQVSFTQDNTDGCYPLTVTYTNNSIVDYGMDTNGVTFIWRFDNGDSAVGFNAVYTFTETGTFNVDLSADSTSNGFFINNTSEQTQVFGVQQFQINPDTIFCPGVSIGFSYFGQYDSLLWDYGDGSEMESSNYVSHTYLNTDTFMVRLIVADMTCGMDTVWQAVRPDTTAMPNVMIYTNAMSACKNDKISFWTENSMVSDTYVWDFGDGDSAWTNNPTHAYANTGTYKVKLVQTNSCGNSKSDSISIVIDMISTANANFGTFGGTPRCPNDMIEFNNQSSPGDYMWDFDDGNTSSEVSPMHAYTSTGNYDIELIVTNSCGFSDAALFNLEIQYDASNPPGVSLSFEDYDWMVDSISICPGIDIEFNNKTWGSDPVSYSWDFGDGEVDSAQNVSHVFSTTGWNETELIATNNCMAADTGYLWVMVDPNLIPSTNIMFIPDTICPNENAFIMDDEQSPEENGYSYDIWYGDGDSTMNITESLKTIPVLDMHQYFSLGNYDYTVVATNICGNTNTTEGVFTVDLNIGNPFYYIGNSAEPGSGYDKSGCIGDSVSFMAVGGVDWFWNFDDGSPQDTGSSVLHAYADTGTYIAEVYITNGCGGMDTVHTEVRIDNTNIPDAWFDAYPQNVCPGDTVWFENNCCGGDDGDFNEANNETVLWTFDDGDSAWTEDTYHVYAAGDMYNVNKTVTNGCGSNNNNQQISVYDLPVIGISGIAASYCIDDAPVAVTGSPSGGSLSGLGMASGSFDPAAAGDGVSFVSYEVTDGNGCWNTDSVSTTVYELPIADAGPDAFICAGGDAQLNATGGESYVWTPNTDLSSDDVADPIANPAGTTKYYVQATGQGGCMAVDLDSVTVDVSGALAAEAGLDDTLCIGDTIMLSGSGGGLYTWWPSAGLSNTSVGNPMAMPTVDTEYYMAVSSGTCSDTDTVVVIVNDLPTVTLGAYSNVCSDVTSWALTGGAPGGGTYWGTGVTAGNFDPDAAGPGTHAITYDYTDANGCSNSDMEDITVNALPSVNLAPIDDACIDATSLTLTGGLPGGGGYVGPGVSGGTFDPAAAGVGVHTIKYGYTNGSGCTDTSAVNIEVFALPVVSLGPLADACETDSAFALATGTPAGGQYTGDDVTFGWFDPIAAGISTTTITYALTDGNGCWAQTTDDIDVVALPIPVINQAGITLSTGASFVTFEWLLDGAPIAGVDSNSHDALATGNYEVVVSNLSGCSDTSVVYPFILVSVKGYANNDKVSVHPNPTKGRFAINHGGKDNTIIEIFDLTGKRVYHKVVSDRSGKHLVDFNNEPKGMYMVRVKSGDKTNFRKVVKH